MKIKEVLNRWDGEIFDCYITINDVWYQAIPVGPWECTYDKVEVWRLFPLTRHQEGAAKYSCSSTGKGMWRHIWNCAKDAKTPYVETLALFRDMFPRPRYMDPHTNQIIETVPPCGFYTHFEKDHYLDDYTWEFEDSELSPWNYNKHTYRGEHPYYMDDGYDTSCLVPYTKDRPGYYISPFR